MKRVLVVDDSATMRRYCAEILEQAGFVVEAVSNGYEALEKILEADEGYDLFLIDINMPKMPGYELIRKLRENERTLATPVVIVSTEAQEKDRLKGFEAGANLYFVKPVKPETLAFLGRLLAG